MMNRRNTFPRQTTLAAALAATLASMSPGAAMAQTTVNGAQAGPLSWSTGDFTVTGSGAVTGVGEGVIASGAVGTLTNSGTISAGNAGIFNGYGGALGTIAVLTNNADGTISGSQAIFNSAGSSIGTLTNGGTISGSQAIVNNGAIDTLTNNGTITTDAQAQAINNSPGGFIGLLNNQSGGVIGGALARTGVNNLGTIGTLTNSGTISAGSFSGIFNVVSIGTLTNSGTISGGSFTGIFNEGSIGTLTNSGTISGAKTGISNDGTIDTLTNSGTISGASFSGIFNRGSIGTLTNSGTISGTINSAKTGIFNGGTIGSLINSGLITGSVNAIANDPSAPFTDGAVSTLGTITNSGVIAGNILNTASNDLNINGGSGSVFGTLTGFGATVGTITNQNSNVVFGSGNLLLNDNIDVGGNAVNNNGTAVLQVNQPVTITGNYNQAGGTLQVGAVSAAQAGQLIVTGNTTMTSGAVSIVPAGFALAPGQRYVVVDTAGTATYGSGLTYSAAGLTATGTSTISGGHQDLVVTLSAAPVPVPVPTPTPTTTPTPTPAPTPEVPRISQNARSSLAGLSHFTGIDNARLLNLFNASLALDQGSGNAANRAGKQLNPLSPVSTSRAAAAPALNVLDIVSTRVNGLRLAQAQSRSGISTGESGPAQNVWGQAFGGHASQDERAQVDGYSANFGGLLIGADRAVSDAWRAGGVFSYSNAQINNTGDTSGNTTRVNSYGLTGYASYTASQWYANLSAGVVQQHYDTHRQVDFTGFSGDAGGSFNGTQYVARAEAGYPLAVGAATVTPLAGLTYSYLHQKAYTETGGNGAALSVSAAHAASVASDIGLKISRELATQYGAVVPELQIGWRHDYDNARVRTQASYAADAAGETSFTSLGASPVTNSAVVSAGVTLLRANNLSLTARYTVQAGSGYVAQAGMLRLRQLF